MDFDEIDDQKGDLFQSLAAIYDNSNIKIAFILFVIYVILNTDIFAERVLRKIRSDTYDMTNDKVTSTGILVSGMILSITYIFIDLLASGDVI